MKRILAVVVMFALCLGLIPVSAQEASLNAEIKKDEHDVWITGSVTPAQEQIVTLFIYLPLKEAPSAAKGDLLSFCYYAAETRTAEDGSFSFYKALSKNDQSGRYQVRIGTAGITPAVSDSFFHVSEDEYQKLYEKMTEQDETKKLTDAKLDAELESMREVYQAMGAELDVYFALPSKTSRLKVCKAVLDVSKFADGKDVIRVLNEQIALETLNQSKDAQAFSNTLSSFQTVLGLDVTKAGSEEKQAEVWRLMMQRMPYQDIKSLQAEFGECCAVAAINVALWGAIPKVIEAYKNIFKDLLSGDYSKLTQNRQAVVCQAMADATFSTSKEFTEAFADCVAAQLKLQAKDDDDSSDKNSHKSGGGGRSNGGGVPQLPELTPIDPLPTQTLAPEFSDLEHFDWAKEHIVKLREMEIISGTDDRLFEPNRGVNKEEFIKMVVLASNDFNAAAECSFTDVERGAWYYPYVASAVSAGLVLGNTTGQFGSGTQVSRQDAAVILCRFLEKKGVALSASEETVFADEGNIADYALQAVKKLHQAGIIKGFEDRTFLPDKLCSRAEAAVMISHALTAAYQEE